MKVLHLVGSLEMGGMETLIVEIAALAKERGSHTPVIGSLKESLSFLVRRAQEAALEVAYFDHKRSFTTVRHIADFINREKIDLVHTHNTAHLKGLAAARKCRVPLVHTKHGNTIPANKLLRWRNNRAIKRTDRMIAVSGCVRETILANYNVPPEKVVRVYNGIDVDRFHPRGDYKLDDALVRIVSVGRLSKEKDIPMMFKAFALVLGKFPQAELNIIGDGPEREPLEKMAAEMEIMDSVQFLGMRDRVWEILPKFDIFMQTSVTEGMPLTVLEAMASGLPAVVTDVGGNSEIITTGENGFLVPSGSAEKAAEAVIRLLEDQSLREKTGRSARRRVEEEFSLQAMVTKYEEIYTTVMQS